MDSQQFKFTAVEFVGGKAKKVKAPKTAKQERKNELTSRSGKRKHAKDIESLYPGLGPVDRRTNSGKLLIEEYLLNKQREKKPRLASPEAGPSSSSGPARDDEPSGQHRLSSIDGDVSHDPLQGAIAFDPAFEIQQPPPPYSPVGAIPTLSPPSNPLPSALAAARLRFDSFRSVSPLTSEGSTSGELPPAEECAGKIPRTTDARATGLMMPTTRPSSGDHPFPQPTEGGNNKDFVADVRGVELSQNAPEIEWPGGFRTVAPFIPDEQDPTRNILELDEKFVRSFAEKAFREPSTPLVTVLVRSEFEMGELRDRIRSELGKGNTVVLKGFDPSLEQYAFSMESVMEERRISLNTPAVIHDPVKRLTSFEKPQQETTYKEFFNRVFDHNKIAFVLDIVSRVPLCPEIILRVDDSRTARTDFQGIDGRKIKQFKDVENTRNWDLLHSAGALTLEHHDAEGSNTFAAVRTGGKMWGVVRPKGYTKAKTHKELNALNKLFIREGWKGNDLPSSWALKWEQKGGDVYAIPAVPGDLVIMPPGTWHMVYTPIRTVASGGHFMTYESMHLTEAARRFDKRNGLCVTNTTHVSTYETLTYMLLNVLRLDERSVHRKPLDALCRMVINHEDYIAQTGDPALTRSINATAMEEVPKLASVVAKYFCTHFGFNMRDKEYLFRDGPWMEPGPILDMRAAFKDWDSTPLRPSSSPGDYQPSIDEIIYGEWVPPSQRQIPLHVEPTLHVEPRETETTIGEGSGRVTRAMAKKGKTR